MLEIFLVIYLCRRIKNIVAPKGYKPGRWQLYTVLTWVSCELVGGISSFLLINHFYVAVLSGVLCAVGGYLFLQGKAQHLPDRSVGYENSLDKIGQEDQQNY